MATVLSAWAKGQRTPARPQSAGAVHAAKFEFDFSTVAYTASGNVLELGILPAFADIVDAVLIPEGNFGGVTVSVGLLAGEVGDTSVRVQGTEIFAAATALTAAVRLSQVGAFKLASTGVDRGIGVTFSGDVAAAANKKLTLLLQYRQ